MSTRRKIFLLIGGLLGLVLVLSVVLYFSAAKLINSESVKEQINAYLIGKAGASITYGNSEFHLFPLPEIIFHQVQLSIPDKAEGSVLSLKTYPSLWSLIKGKVRIAKLSLEAPDFTVKISEDMDKPSLEEIEEKVRSVTHYLASAMPGLRVGIRGGKLEFTKGGKIAFSFDLIQSQISVSQKKLDIEITSRSNLWDNFSVSSSIEADNLKSNGTIRLKHLRPDKLIAFISEETARQVGVSGADMSVKFEAAGLRVVNASMESSVSELSVSRGKKRTTLGETIIKGDIEIKPEAVSVRIKQAKISRPALNFSGQYDLNRNSGIITVTLEGKSISVQPVRDSALGLGEDIPLIRNIFTILRGGEITVLSVNANGKSLAELGQTKSIRIAGKMRAGIIYIEAKDLMFQNVSG
ncbi:MAG: AsmA family, partial [Nitrospirae bacterium]|nr:AsmA family [Nitrospirota bacterium]